MSSFAFIYLFFIIFPLSLTSPLHSVKVQLVHFDSPDSPHHIKYDSVEQKHQRWNQLSVNRLVKIYHHLVSGEDALFTYHPDLILDPSGVFLASFGIGTPTTPQLLALDTGSSLMWVTCIYSRAQAGGYNYMKSSTYKRVGCNDYECQMNPFGPTCANPYEECQFQLAYASSGGVIRGFIVRDAFTFRDGSKGENTTLPLRPFFGCGFLEGPIHRNFIGTGVLGLSNHLSSIATQFGLSFSYCIGNMHNTSYVFNNLILGKGKLLGTSTPIRPISSKIFVNLQRIAVDGEVLAINPSVFKRYDSGGGTILDSGSAVTYLADDAYQVLNDKLKEKMKPVGQALCFQGLQPEDVPVVQFIFEQGANLTLGIDALFSPSTSNVQCFSGVKATSTSSGIADSTMLSLIGINAQQHHNIGYDYPTRRVYMSLTERN